MQMMELCYFIKKIFLCMNKTTYSLIGSSLLALHSISFWQSETDKIALTIEENIANTLKDACIWKKSTEYLNCRLLEPTNSNYENDIKLRRQMEEMRSRWNFFLTTSLPLPLEIRENRFEELRMAALFANLTLPHHFFQEKLMQN